MKKISVLLAFISAFCFAFAFGGCGGKQQEEQTEQLKGKFYKLFDASNNGWIDEDDLESIACCYYDWRGFDVNPYSGKFTSTEELSEKTEAEIIKAYDDSEEVKIFKYFGTYGTNIAVTLGYESEDYTDFEARDVTVGDVTFPDFRYVILIYHYPEQKSPSLQARSALYTVQRAYETGRLSEDDLKSLSCYFYDINGEENPYSGLYEAPTEKLSREMKSELKLAYLKQIAKQPNGELDNVIIHKLYGIYGIDNKYIVVSITGYGCVYSTESTGIEIGGVTFCVGLSNVYIYQSFN